LGMAVDPVFVPVPVCVPVPETSMLGSIRVVCLYPCVT